jgi:hypothetical protein
LWRSPQDTAADAVMVKRLGDWVDLMKNKNHASKDMVVALAAQYGVTDELDDLPF